MQYIIEYDIAAIILSIAVLFGFLRKKILYTSQTRNFVILTLLIILSAFFDIVSVYFINHPELVSIPLNYVIQITYHVPYQFLAFTFFYCIASYGGIKHFNSVKLQVKDFFVVLPCVLVQILVITTPFTHLYFYFDENCNYVHGALFKISYIVSGVYLISTIISAYKAQTKLGFKKVGAVYLYTMMIIVSVFIQFFFPDLLIVGFVASLGDLLIFLTLDDPANYMDKTLAAYNRNAFEMVVSQFIENNQKIRFFAIQVKDLTHINDSIGRQNTDKFLNVLIQRVNRACNHSPLFRLSGSRFVVILSNEKKNQKKIIENISRILDSSFEVDAFSITPTIAMTIFSYPDDVETIEDITAIMEDTLIEMPESSFGKVVPANPMILEKKKEEYTILQYLKDSIQQDSFEVVYQPIYDLQKKRFTRAEALVRLKDSDGNYFQTEDLISTAEKNGLIFEIGILVFNKICQFIQSTKITDYGIEKIDINLSAIQCMQPQLWIKYLSILAQYGVKPECINFEVKEEAAMVAGDSLRSIISNLETRRIYFSMDGFGTEHSNTLNLVNFDFRMIKLDQSMIHAAMFESKARSVFIHDVRMIKALNKKVLVEGVEDEIQLRFLETLDCDYVQGFYYSRPVGEDELLQISLGQKR